MPTAAQVLVPLQQQLAALHALEEVAMDMATGASNEENAEENAEKNDMEEKDIAADKRKDMEDP